MHSKKERSRQMKPLITVAVPVYNAELFLDRCIKSIAAQTYENLQIILVNDGSVDYSDEICRKWAEKDRRIQVLEQENRGQAYARNKAVESAKGQYICFVDADDSIAPDFIEILLGSCEETGADIAVCREERFGKRSSARKVLMSGLEATAVMFEQNRFDVAPWGKLVKTSLVREYPLPENTLYEDLAGTYRWFMEAEKVVFQNLGLYRYTVNPNGISLRKFDKRNFEQLIIVEQLYKNLFHKSERLKKALISRRFSICCKLLIENGGSEQYSAENQKIRCFLKKDALTVLFHGKRIKNKVAAALFLAAGEKGLHTFGNLKSHLKN